MERAVPAQPVEQWHERALEDSVLARANARAAGTASCSVRSRARAWIAGPVGLPKLVEGAISTSGLRRSRFTFHALS
jgi:hypothetical protein